MTTAKAQSFSRIPFDRKVRYFSLLPSLWLMFLINKYRIHKLNSQNKDDITNEIPFVTTIFYCFYPFFVNEWVQKCLIMNE